MLNAQIINGKLHFEDFVEARKLAIGSAVEVPDGGPWSVKRYVITSYRRVANGKIGYVAEPVVRAAYSGFFANYNDTGTKGVVDGSGAVVAHIVFDEVADLWYVGDYLEDLSAPCGCGDTLLDALKDWVAKKN